MKKLLTFLFCFGLLSNGLFAQENKIAEIKTSSEKSDMKLENKIVETKTSPKKGDMTLSIGVGYSKFKQYSKTTYFKSDLISEHSKEWNSSSTSFPLLVSAGYKFYIIDNLSLEPRINIGLAESDINANFMMIRNQNLSTTYYGSYSLKGKLNEVYTGFEIPVQYDFYKFSEKNFLGIELALGYERAFIFNKFNTSIYYDNINALEIKDNQGSFTFGYGIYYVSDNTHKFSLIGHYRNYKDFKTQFSGNQTKYETNYFKDEFVLKPTNSTITFSYTYLY